MPAQSTTPYMSRREPTIEGGFLGKPQAAVVKSGSPRIRALPIKSAQESKPQVAVRCLRQVALQVFLLSATLRFSSYVPSVTMWSTKAQILCGER